jgi:soluble lytic murein transglycosylase-like protein
MGSCLRALLLGLLLHAACTTASAQERATPPKIYKYSSGGTTAFSDRPPADGRFTVLMPTCFACSLSSTVDWHSTVLFAQRFSPLIEQTAQRFQLDPALVRAVIHAESGFNPAARSRKGAMGLMQLMPGTARLVGVSDAWLPDQNIAGGVRYLADLLQQFRGDQKLAVAAYNAGPEAVRKYAGIPPYAETQAYVQRVQILQHRYRQGTAG